MLEVNPNLTQQQVRDCLINNARTDTFTGTVPNTDWGAGKLDSQASFNCAKPPKFKFADDPKLKFIDDPKFKFFDDPKLKFIDDPKFKFIDDPIGTPPFIDPLKQPALDKPPHTDIGGGTNPETSQINPGNPPSSGNIESSTPFVMSTPHHSNAWSQSYPEAYQQTIKQMEATIQQYYQQLQQIEASMQNRQLSDTEMQQVKAIYTEYEKLVREYRQLIGQSPS